jgi:hypothetical protein
VEVAAPPGWYQPEGHVAGHGPLVLGISNYGWFIVSLAGKVMAGFKRLANLIYFVII